jgi:hypothetical protein
MRYLLKIMDTVCENPLLALLLFLVLFFGGCEIAVKIHIVSSSTRLMPY